MSENLRFYQPDTPYYTGDRKEKTYSKISIAEASLKPKDSRLNVFELDVVYMHGDADGYTRNRHVYENTEEGIKDLLGHGAFLYNCMTKYPHGMGGEDGYWDVKDFDKYGEEEIPRDNPYCSGHAHVESFGVIYVDPDGVEFPVTLE